LNLQVRLHDLLTTDELAAREDFRVGDALVSPSTRTVKIGAAKLDVEPRVMQVLVVLADAGGAVVTRETLFRRCWGSPAVTNDSLNRAIFGLRRVAAGCQGAFDVETIPRVGYRLTLLPVADEPEAAWRMSRRQIVACGSAALLLPAGWLAYRRVSPEASANAQLDAMIARSDQMVRNGAPPTAPIQLLEKAVKIAPEDARAWGRLALARYDMVEHAPPAQVTAAVAGTEDAARRALALDPRCADALCAMAQLPPYYGDWAAAERRMRAVLEIDSEHLPTRDALDFMLAGAGREHEGSRDRVAVAARDPLHVVYQFKLVYALWILGDVAGADRVADRALQLWPSHSAVWFARLWLLALTGRPERALAQIDDVAALPKLPQDTLKTVRAGVAAMASRRPQDVADATEAAVRMINKGPSEVISSTMLLMGLSAIDRLFDVADAYLLESGPLIASVQWRPGELSVKDQHRRKTNMFFLPPAEAMQAHPRFMPLMNAVGLVRYWDQMGVEPDFLRRRRGV
jgi:DNA-binding winged helix-turn-helix (wHTH) protein/tetratricopeptide (TPR) repeat protein